MKLFNFILLIVFVLSSLPKTPIKKCFCLDKMKIDTTLIPLTFSNKNSSIKIRLEKQGILKNNDQKCKWSLNGGSGTKDLFSLDGNFAVPILNPDCETPFSHVYTGVGFRDWYLTICGQVINDQLTITNGKYNLSIRIDSLYQWTEYEPGNFPISGDIE